jgi:hypothetical protein
MMFEEDLADEEVKKKKRRVLGLLFIFLLLGWGALAAFPLAELSPPPATAGTQAAVVTPAHTVAPPRPTLVAAGTATGVPTPGVGAATASLPKATPQRTATSTMAQLTPVVTQEAPGGFGGGTPDVSLTAIGAPAGASPTVASSALTGTATGVPTPSVEATTASLPEATPQQTATAAMAQLTPDVTQETPGGFGGGTPGVSLAATGTPAGAYPALATPTPMGHDELPVTGAGGGRGSGWLVLGVVASLLGALMLGAGCALHNTKPR